MNEKCTLSLSEYMQPITATATKEQRCLLTECEVTGWEARCKEKDRKCCSASGSVGM